MNLRVFLTIGVQVFEFLLYTENFSGDEIGGISVSVRDRDDIVTIWNTRSDLAEQSTIMEKVQELVPSVTFTANFYKGN